IGRIQQLHATTDKLTGLLNRYAGSAKLSEEFEYGAGNSTDLAVILVDVDHFKEINDFHGHLVGDKVLKEFGDVISNFIRKTDSVVRWGGEEFLVILPNTTIENGARLAERLREEIDQRVFATQLHVTASFGVASRQHGQDMEALFHAADQAMYKAKKGGRNQVVVHPIN
ncbi:MAG TPA: GGDEF domain-containing protein, partial [Anaerolineales bacterium]|nr:GGDEF domain-containing protein [Anaerolineales bacterium]